jgi:four helix bundle protein
VPVPVPVPVKSTQPFRSRAEVIGMLDYEKLDVYQCAIDRLSCVFKWLPLLPRGDSALADQWRRAAMSTPLNVAEGAGKTGVAERAHCYAVARGEAMECGAILDVVRLLNGVPDADLVRGKQLVVRMVEMLTKMCC